MTHFPQDGYIPCHSNPSSFHHQNIWRRVRYKSWGPSLCILLPLVLSSNVHLINLLSDIINPGFINA
jgi:hypothetical protein